MATVMAVSNDLSFISDPGVSCLLLALMELGQANLPVCKDGTISDLHHSSQLNLPLLSVRGSLQFDLLALNSHKLR